MEKNKALRYTTPLEFAKQNSAIAQAAVKDFNKKCPQGTQCGLWTDGGQLVLFDVLYAARVVEGHAKIWVPGYGSYLLGAVRPVKNSSQQHEDIDDYLDELLDSGDLGVG